MLAIENLSFAYDQSPILSDISMTFKEGQITGILGANGSGKSTLMKLITKLLLPDKGKIMYQGQEVLSTKKALYPYRQAVNMVFQDPEQQLFYALVKDDVAMVLKNLGFSAEEVQARVTKALKMMGVYCLRDRPLQYLSYGQKKRVAIAGMLTLEPKYLLLDEPTAGLDPKGKERMVKSMRELVASGTNIILTSHDMDLMYDCCDYAYLLAEGRLLAQGDKYQLFQEVDLLEQAGLEAPWLVKLHQALGTPLSATEADFFKQMKGQSDGSINYDSRHGL